MVHLGALGAQAAQRQVKACDRIADQPPSGAGPGVIPDQGLRLPRRGGSPSSVITWKTWRAIVRRTGGGPEGPSLGNNKTPTDAD